MSMHLRKGQRQHAGKVKPTPWQGFDFFSLAGGRKKRPVKVRMKSQHRGAAHPLAQQRQSLCGRGTKALRPQAKAVDQHILLAGQGIARPDQQVQAVAHHQTPLSGMAMDCKGCDMKHLALAGVKARGFKVEDDPAVLIHWSAKGPVQQAHRM